jgi:ATP-dependent Clp protease ATP-binding subunit ClpA
LSQFTESWSMSRFIGAEPGYVGYSERSGLLAKAAEDSPHSVLYFRNVDVAHTIVQQFLGEAFEQGRFTDATGARISLSNTTIVMSLSQMSETNKHAPVGFLAPSETSGEHRPTGNLRATGSLHIKERGAGFGLTESLAATIDEVIEFQVLDRAATEKIIAERFDALKARLEAAQNVTIKMDPQLVSFFSERLRAERKSLAQLERLLQEAIIIPFTHLHLDRRATGARSEVNIFLEDGTVRVDTDERSFQ